MNEIITILEALSPTLSVCELRRLVIIVEATLAMTGRVTMLGMSRWSERGGSYRTIQRFFGGKFDWAKLRWVLIKRYLVTKQSGTWLLAGDEVVITKSGKKTFGLGRFFSSLQKQPVPGLCFLNVSLIHVDSRKSYPLLTEQLVRDDVKETAPKASNSQFRGIYKNQ